MYARSKLALLTAALVLSLSACAPATPEELAAEEAATAAEAAAASAPRPAPQPRAPEPVVCADCGTVSSITEVKQKGAGSGAGAAIGAIAGGVAGHQVGGGSGKDVATAVGAIAGAMAGHEVEKRARSTLSYDVAIAMDAGGSRVINVTALGPLSVGSKVRVEGSTIVPR